MTTELWLGNLAAYGLQVAILVLAGGVLMRLFRIRSPLAVLAFWQTLLAACLLLPALEPWRPPLSAGPGTSTAAFAETGSGTITPAAGPAAPPVTIAAAPSAARMSKSRLALMILAAGVALRLLWLALGMMRLRRYRDRSRRPAALPEVIRDLQRRIGAAPETFFSHEVDTPVAFGWRRPAVIFPSAFLAMGENLQRPIACHELVHVRRRDWLAMALEEVLRALLWFHPAIWWLLGRIRLSREQVVDREVLRITGERETYLECLLQIAALRGRPAAFPAPLFLNERHLLQRVALILKESAMTRSRLITSLAVISLALLWTGVQAAAWLPLTAPPGLQNRAPQPERVSQVPQARQLEPITVDGRLMESKLVTRVEPVYPETARRARLEGTVALEVLIDEQGVVERVRIIRGGYPPLQPAARDAVLQWRYAPTFLDGRAVKVLTTVNVTFRLPPGSAIAVAPSVAPVAPPRPRQPLRAGGVVQDSKLIHRVEPVYPELARRTRAEAVIVMEVQIDEQGDVTDVSIARGHPLFDQAAIDAVKQWRYSPTLLNGEPVPVVTTVTIPFRIQDTVFETRILIGDDGSLKELGGNPVTSAMLQRGPVALQVSSGSKVPFAAVERALAFLRDEGVRDIRLLSTTYLLAAGRLFYTTPPLAGTHFVRPIEIPTSIGARGIPVSPPGGPDPTVRAPVLDLNLDSLASLAKASGRLAQQPAGSRVALGYTVFVTELGEIVAVEGSMRGLTEVETALRQARVLSPGQRNSQPVPTAVPVPIMVIW